MMVVPYQLLQPEILNTLVEDFVTRNGAIHGHTDATLHEMATSVRDKLESGEAEIVFDEETQSWTIVQKVR